MFLIVLHLSTCSLSSHINKLNLLLFSLNVNFDIICISESRITNFSLPASTMLIPSYNIEQTPTESSAGGSLIYIPFLIKTDLTSKYTKLNIWIPTSLKSFFQISPTVY